MSALLTWLGETPAQKSSNTTPAYLTFGMSGKHLHGHVRTSLTMMFLQCSLLVWYAAFPTDIELS